MRTLNRHAFTLVELLVVIGIIGLLIAMLMPTLSKAKNSANLVACASNMRQIGLELRYYCDNYGGWIFPVGKDRVGQPGVPRTLGADNQTPPWKRWPMYVFKFSHPAVPVEPPNAPDNYWVAFAAGPGAVMPQFDAIMFNDADPWTPKIMRCPTDYEPIAQHSYVLNQHLADKRVRINNRVAGKSDSDVVVMGEKKTDVADYYLEKNQAAYDPNYVDTNPGGSTEFSRVVEKYRHGVKSGANYLYKDTHVAQVPPAEANAKLDPWNVP